jgi:hypothetical protein
MTEVVVAVAPTLKAARFRRRRHSFNRTTDAGVIQVVSFQMGPYRPPNAHESGGGRLYGKFTINLGVYLASLARQLYRVPEGEWINEYDCHLRQRIGQLLPAPEDIWWSLSDARLATQVADQAWRDHGLPWLETVTTERDIIDLYNRSGRVAVGFNPVAPVRIALMHMASGDLVHAEQLLRDHLASGLLPAHRQYLRELLSKHGLGYLCEE